MNRAFVLSTFAVAMVMVLMTGCALESVPADRRKQNEAARDAFEREIQQTSEASDRVRAEQQQRIMADPGSLSIQESDATIAALRSASPFERASAAGKLGDAKGARAVNALVAGLKAETDPTAFSAMVQALIKIHDARAIDAFVEALTAPNMPDNVREQAFNGIVEFGSAWRLRPQIQRFYDSLTDDAVRARVRPIVEEYSTKPHASH